jgi:hypothetical protein
LGIKRTAVQREKRSTMEAQDRRIIFMIGGDNVLCELPLDEYVPGDISETKERLAEEMNCGTEQIEVRITGIRRAKRV